MADAVKAMWQDMEQEAADELVRRERHDALPLGTIAKVSLWLGHATLTTTEIYTRGDPTEKLDAMELIVPPHLRRGAFQPSDRLIALLKRPS